MALDQGTWVDDVEASPDGKWLATTAASGTVRIYDTATWTLQKSFPTESDSVHGLAWSPDSQKLAAACGNGNLHLWNLATGLELLKIVAHQEGANDVVYSHDGKTLYSCGVDHLAKCWDVEAGDERLVFAGHEGTVNQLVLWPDGSKLATMSNDETFAIWDAQTAKCLHHIDLRAQGRMVCGDISPDGNSLIVGSIYGHIFLVNPQSGVYELLTRELDGVEDLMFLAAGRYLASVGRGGTLHIYPAVDLANSLTRTHFKPALRWAAHADRATTLTALGDGKTLITGGRDGQIRIWTPDMQGTRWSINSRLLNRDHDTGPEHRLYRAASREIEIWDTHHRQIVKTIAASDSVWVSLACSRDGRFLASLREGQLALFSLPDFDMIREWRVDKAAGDLSITLSSNGRFVAYKDDIHKESVFLCDRDSVNPPLQLSAEQCRCVAFSPDNRWLAAGNMDDLKLFDLRSGGPPRVLSGHTSTLIDVAFSPDGQWLATVSHDRLLKIWQVATGEERFSIIAHSDKVKTVAFSPDGKTIATGGDDYCVKLWDMPTGQPLGTLRTDGYQVELVRFSREGLRLTVNASILNVRKLLIVYDAAPPPDGYVETSLADKTFLD